MVDLHSHILWGIDDGAKNEEMTIEMLRIAEHAGTEIIFATPHYLRDRYEVKYSELDTHFEELTKLAKSEGINVEIKLGQEVYYCENILELYENKEVGCIKGTNYMLVELPMRDFEVEDVCEVLYELQVRGVKIIIAHPERYKPFVENNNLIKSFIREGFLFQLNGGSIVGDFGKDVEKLSKYYLESNIYNFIGSDAHRVDIRTPNLTKALAEIDKINDEALERFELSSQALINNDEIEFEGRLEIKKRKGLFSFLKKGN